MSRIDPFGAGLSLGLLVGGAHTVWAVLVASGAAPWILDVVFRLHFIRPPFDVDGFDLSVAAFLVAMTTFAGLALGWAFAAIWNGLATLRATAPVRR
jgi:hypothetical protein